MKTLQFSSLTVLLFSFFLSCTKTPIIEQSGASTSSSSVISSGIAAKESKVATVTKAEKKPVLTASYNPMPVTKGKSVTVTYTATSPDDQALLSCGKITIYQLIEGAWIAVGSGNAPSASVTIPTTESGACAYSFRAAFTPGGEGAIGCKGAYGGVGEMEGEALCVKVEDPCVETFTIGGSATAVRLENGLYEFTITYTLESPKAIEDLHFQGGATAGGNTGHVISSYGDFTIRNANNNNTVLQWDGSLQACTKKTLTFKYTRKFICPVTDALVTGSWTASSAGTVLGNIAELPYACN